MNRVLLSGVRVWITKEVIRVNPQLLKSHTSEWRAAGGALHWIACVNPHFFENHRSEWRAAVGAVTWIACIHFCGLGLEGLASFLLLGIQESMNRHLGKA